MQRDGKGTHHHRPQGATGAAETERQDRISHVPHAYKNAPAGQRQKVNSSPFNGIVQHGQMSIRASYFAARFSDPADHTQPL